MPFSYNETEASVGQTTVNVTFPYLARTHVNVSVNGAAIPQVNLSWTGPSQITLPSALAGGETVRVYRTTPASELTVNFTSSVLDHRDLNRVNTQLLYVVQEAYDYAIVTGELADSVVNYLTQVTALHDETEAYHDAVQAVAGSVQPAYTQIAAATPKASPAGSDMFGGVVAAGTSLFRTTFDQLQEWVRTKLGAMISASGAKSTPVDADQIAISDSAASSGPAKVSFLNLWANYIKAKADAVYQGLSGILTSLSGLTLASGDILYASASNTLAKLAKGADGQFLTLSGGVPAWQNTGRVLLDTFTTTSGTSFTTQTISSRYRELVVECEGVSSTSTGNLRMEANGSSGWGTAFTIMSIANTTDGVFAYTTILGAQLANASKRIVSFYAAAAGNNVTEDRSNLTMAGPSGITQLRFSWSSGTFDAGTIRVYGVA